MISLPEIKSHLVKNHKFWIAFTGDSITSCEWVHPNWRDILLYVLQTEITSYLKGDWKTSEWGIRGFNFAFDGATTSDILTKVDDLLLIKPDLTIGLMGGNDPTFKISLNNHINNIEKTIGRLIASGSQVVWCNSIPAGKGSVKNSEYQPYAEEMLKIPQRENFQLIDTFHLYQQFPLERIFTFKSEENPVENIKVGDPDLQHPNQLGNAYIAEIILKQVFNLNFDAEKYVKESLSGEKYPGY